MGRGRAAAKAKPPKAPLPVEDDSRLAGWVEAIADADQAALACLYDATVGRVYGVALRIVRRPELAEEVVSDVYLQAWREAGRYDASRGKVLAWLMIIARSRALDFLRRQDEAFSHPDPHELGEEPFDPADNPHDLLAAARGNRALLLALETLTPIQRQLLALAFFQGLSHSEIVDHSGIPLGSVKTHIRRALGVLRERLGENFDVSR
ncbi:MAG: sigma-70 family RNA polymerase sigma factor [Betaproteobacteria bacterium]|nr:sigma-70 family RNA polymerase sigma factor [Betaproteobacteria bacterium]